MVFAQDRDQLQVLANAIVTSGAVKGKEFLD
jgi:hypothetical protein